MNIYTVLKHCLAYVESTARTWLRLDDNYEERLVFQSRVFQDRFRFDGKAFGTPNLLPIYQLHRDYDGTKATLVALIRARWN